MNVKNQFKQKFNELFDWLTFSIDEDKLNSHFSDIIFEKMKRDYL